MRKALPGDVELLVELMAEFYAESTHPFDRRRATEAFAALLADPRLGHAWLIQADGQDVGYLVLTLGYSMEFGGLSAFVDDLFIRPAFRHAGLGTAALAETRAFCEALGARAVQLEVARDNAVAISVYRRAGYQDTNLQLLTLRLGGRSSD
jgi:ribosomal protein S18 acetylase RimI-like enzyme